MPDIPILQPAVLNGVVEKFLKPETLVGITSPALMGGDRVQPNPDPTVTFDVIKGSRELARPNTPNSEAHIVKQLGVAQITANMIYLREKKVFSPTTLRWLRTPGTLGEKNATAAVLREIQDLDNRFAKFQEFVVWKAFTTGIVSVTSGGVIINIDYKFPATHKPTVSTAWSDPAATIVDNVQNWKRLISRDGQAVARFAYLNDVAMQHVVKNTEIRSLLSDTKKDEFLNTGVLRGLLNLDWIVYDLAYVDDNGNIVQFIPDDRFVLLSTDNPDRWFFYEGPSADEEAPEGHIGRFAKTWTEPDPSARQYLLEYHFLPAIIRNEQIVAAKITP